MLFLQTLTTIFFHSKRGTIYHLVDKMQHILKNLQNKQIREDFRLVFHMHFYDLVLYLNNVFKLFLHQKILGIQTDDYYLILPKV